MLPSLEKVLVVGPSWVGDMVMAQSLFISLKQKNPDVRIDVVAPDWSLPLLTRMPEVREGIGLPVGHGELKLAQRWRIGRLLKKTIAYQQAIVLPRSFKSALIPFFARIPVRTGYRGELRFGLINDMRSMRKKLDQTVKRFAALGLRKNESDDVVVNGLYPQPRLRIDSENQLRLLDKLDLDKDKPVISLMPGAEYGPAKQWPLASFAELARHFYEKGFQVWILGSEKDSATANEILELSENAAINLCGKTTLTDAVDLIAYSKVAVSNDSGLMHIAAAVGCPLVAIYGSSSPAFTPPLTERASIMYLNVECSPCFKRECPFGHYKCLREIGVETVAVMVDRRLAN